MESIKVVPLIPSLNPDYKLEEYVDSLITYGFDKVIIIDDGSSEEIKYIFDNLREKKECIILTHDKNKGKGRAIKTGLKYYLENIEGYYGVVTADADGQHSAKDTYAVAELLQEQEDKLILGVRDFKKSSVPLRSRFGNRTTTFTFILLYGKKISDTQTGLRGMPNEFIYKCLDIEGERFEYEINVLINAVRTKTKVKEIKIQTIYYEDNNKKSNFKTITDSIKVYKLLFKYFFLYTFSGVTSALIDVLTFMFITKIVFKDHYVYSAIFWGTIIARFISSVYNFVMNKKIVFKSKSKKRKTLPKYYTLCVIQALISWAMVSGLFYITKIDEIILKLLTDLIIFYFSYHVQRAWVFKEK